MHVIDIFSILSNSSLLLVATISLFFIFKFARTVENVGFKRRIHISKLKLGDVLLDNKLWEGITEKELKKLKKSRKKFVWIKEGVRFAPTFPIALLFTLYFGDAILILMRSLI